MESLNLNIASEYLVMAAELIEMKSNILLPNSSICETDDYEEDPRKNLIDRLLEYKKYKEITSEFRDLEENRRQYFDKEESSLESYGIKNDVSNNASIDNLLDAFQKLLIDRIHDQPLNTTITKKEYSVSDRSIEIKKILLKKKRISFTELFDVF